jgi:hypothetical protein
MRVSTPDGLPPLREVIRALGLSAKKSLGQNFLFDFNLTRRIARAAGPLKDVTIVEVGPGPGGLTRGFFSKARRASSLSKEMSAAFQPCRILPPCIPAGSTLSQPTRGRWTTRVWRSVLPPASSPTCPTASRRLCSLAG